MRTSRPIVKKRAASDMPASSWIYALPPRWISYAQLARWDRPIGIWLLLFPCWWGVALAAAAHDQFIDISLLALFGLGAIFMRGAGCTINDIIDRDIDRYVARTASRPLASGEIDLSKALFFLGFQLLAGLAILLLFNIEVILLGLIGSAFDWAVPFCQKMGAMAAGLSWHSVLLGRAYGLAGYGRRADGAHISCTL